MSYKSNKEFIKEFTKIQSCDNLEIEYVLVGDYFLGGIMMTQDKYNNTEPDEHGKVILKENEQRVINARLVGYWDGTQILETSTVSDDDYRIVYEKTSEICSCCFNEELYNEKKDNWYCPHCLEHQPWHYRLSEWKRKAISYLPERVKQ